VRIIADACKTDLDGLAREAKALEERKQFIISEDLRLRKKMEEEAVCMFSPTKSYPSSDKLFLVTSQLRQLQLITDEISVKSQELASVYEVSLEPLSPLFYNLIHQFSSEFERYHLDEIVVAAIAPLVSFLQ
jgi:tuftelin-interacting protein 11